MKHIVILFLVLAALLSACDNTDTDLVTAGVETREVLTTASNSDAVDFVTCQKDKGVIEALTDCTP